MRYEKTYSLPCREPGDDRYLEDGLGSVGQPQPHSLSILIPTGGLFASKGMIITRACLALQDSFALRISDFSEHPYVLGTGQ